MAQSRPSVVVVGSANVDMIVLSERLPRPGETVAGGRFLSAGGGKGANQAVAARRLDADVRFIVRLGDDSLGKTIRDTFVAEDLSTTWVRTDSEAATGVALILVDRAGENMISVASGANSRLSPEDVRDSASAFDNAAVLLVQLEIPVVTVKVGLEEARRRNMTTVLNPAPARVVPDDVLGLVDWLTPNEHEAATLVGFPVTTREAALAAARELLERGPRHVVITLGAQGCVYRSAAGELVVEPCVVNAVDSTAAGDAFSAALAVSLARGDAEIVALQYASAAGAVATTRPGAQPSLPTHAEVTALVEETSRDFRHRPQRG